MSLCLPSLTLIRGLLLQVHVNHENSTCFGMNQAVDVSSELSSSISTDIYLATEIYLASNPLLIFTRSAKGRMFDDIYIPNDNNIYIHNDNIPPNCEEPPECNLLLIQFLRMMVDQLMVTAVALIIQTNGLS